MRGRRSLPLCAICVSLGSLLALLPSRPAGAQSAWREAGGWLGESGLASWYGRQHQGQRTASGTHFDAHALTAAHAWLPFGTQVRVTLAGTGRSVVVVVTDRLATTRRIIDLSRAAAVKLGMLGEGLAKVSLSPM